MLLPNQGIRILYEPQTNVEFNLDCSIILIITSMSIKCLQLLLLQWVDHLQTGFKTSVINRTRQCAHNLPSSIRLHFVVKIKIIFHIPCIFRH